MIGLLQNWKQKETDIKSYQQRDIDIQNILFSLSKDSKYYNLLKNDGSRLKEGINEMIKLSNSWKILKNINKPEIW